MSIVAATAPEQDLARSKVSQERFFERPLRVMALFATIETLLLLPYWLGRPSFLREEWEFLWRARHLGAWYAADEPTTKMRPLVRVLYAGLYGIATDHSVVFAVPALLTVGIAVTLYWFSKRLLPTPVAFALALVWLLLPTHNTSNHWIAASNIDLAVIAGLCGLAFFRDRSWRSLALGVALSGIGILLYEAIGPAVFLGALTFASRQPCGFRRRGVLAAAALLPFLFTALLLSVGPRQRTFVSPLVSLYFNFGLFDPVAAPAFVTMIIVVLGTLLVLGRAVRRRQVDLGTQLVSWGMAVWFVGYLPFFGSGYDAMFVGIGDRGNCVSALGVAAVLVGFGRELWQLADSRGRRTFIVCASLLMVGLAGLQMYKGTVWASATRTTKDLGDCLIQREAQGHPIVVQFAPGFMAKSVISVDARTELRHYLITGAEPVAEQYSEVPAGNSAGLRVSALYADPKPFLRSQGCC